MLSAVRRRPIISVAGMVGVGKSTLVRELADALGFQAEFEPVVDNPYLTDFYHDMERWGFHLQLYFLQQRFASLRRMAQAGGGFVQDRSIYEDADIFARGLYESGKMAERDYALYRSCFEAQESAGAYPRPDLLIYLDGTFDTILHRIQSRGRDAERETPVSYWRELYERYGAWIASFDRCPVLRLNVDHYDLFADPDSKLHIASRVAEELVA